jgi:hypothetical protein
MPKRPEIHDLEIVELPSSDTMSQFNVYYNERLVCTFLETDYVINPFVLILDGASRKFQTEDELFEQICNAAAKVR